MHIILETSENERNKILKSRKTSLKATSSSIIPATAFFPVLAKSNEKKNLLLRKKNAHRQRHRHQILVCYWFTLFSIVKKSEIWAKSEIQKDFNLIFFLSLSSFSSFRLISNCILSFHWVTQLVKRNNIWKGSKKEICRACGLRYKLNRDCTQCTVPTTNTIHTLVIIWNLKKIKRDGIIHLEKNLICTMCYMKHYTLYHTNTLPYKYVWIVVVQLLGVIFLT